MRYTPDRRSTNLYMKHDPELKAELRRRAELGLATAKARAPFRSGDLAGSGHVEDMGVGGVKGDRMELQVVFDSDHAAAVVFGNRRSARRNFLRDIIPIIEHG